MVSFCDSISLWSIRAPLQLFHNRSIRKRSKLLTPKCCRIVHENFLWWSKLKKYSLTIVFTSSLDNSFQIANRLDPASTTVKNTAKLMCALSHCGLSHAASSIISPLTSIQQPVTKLLASLHTTHSSTDASTAYLPDLPLAFLWQFPQSTFAHQFYLPVY